MSNSLTSSRRSLSPFWLLCILTGLNLFNYLDRYVLNAVRTPIAKEFHISYTASGVMMTVFMVGYFITAPFFGYLGDRFSVSYTHLTLPTNREV